MEGMACFDGSNHFSLCVIHVDVDTIPSINYYINIEKYNKITTMHKVQLILIEKRQGISSNNFTMVLAFH